MTGLGTGIRGREDKWCCLSFVSVGTSCLGPVAIGRKKKDVPTTSTNVSVFYLCRMHSYGMSEIGNRWIDIYLFISLKQFSLHPQVRHMHDIKLVGGTGQGVPCLRLERHPDGIYWYRPPGYTSMYRGHYCPTSDFALLCLTDRLVQAYLSTWTG